jgi:hypothetical protein
MIRNMLLRSLLWVGVHLHSYKLIYLYTYFLTDKELEELCAISRKLTIEQLSGLKNK